MPLSPPPPLSVVVLVNQNRPTQSSEGSACARGCVAAVMTTRWKTHTGRFSLRGSICLVLVCGTLFGSYRHSTTSLQAVLNKLTPLVESQEATMASPSSSFSPSSLSANKQQIQMEEGPSRSVTMSSTTTSVAIHKINNSSTAAAVIRETQWHQQHRHQLPVQVVGNNNINKHHLPQQQYHQSSSSSQQPPAAAVKVQTPVFVLSLPKSGTTSLSRYFQCGGMTAAHTYGKNADGQTFRLGDCFRQNWQRGRPIADGCGIYDAYADLGYVRRQSCFYPSLVAVRAITRHYPNATIIVSYRNATIWYDSVQKWFRLAARWSAVPSCRPLGFPNTTTPADAWYDFYDHFHRERIRNAVVGAPPLSRYDPSRLRYLEFDLNDPTAGRQLQALTGISAQRCWGDCKPNQKCNFDID